MIIAALINHYSKIFMRIYLFIFFFVLGNYVFSQNSDSLKTTKIDTTKANHYFAGTISATNNGISLLPNLTLGKPAVFFDLSFGNKRLSFDPMLRFQMNGKPWSFILWLRYKLIDQKKFKVGLGAHPAFVFREINATSTAGTYNYTIAQKFFASEITPTYLLNKNNSVGLHYLTGFALQDYTIQRSHFLAIKTLNTHIKFIKDYEFTASPQFYYLKIDKVDGIYASAFIALSKRNIPISLSTTMSYEIDSEIAGDDFVWNVALNYNFNHSYKKSK
jgi:hypothetical protein